VNFFDIRIASGITKYFSLKFKGNFMKVNTIKIDSMVIGEGQKPFLVAELSGNHDGSLDRAKKIIELIAASGFDAIKLQTYTADTMTLDVSTGPFFISDPKSLWAGTSLYELYQRASTPWEWHKELFDYAKSLGLIAFSTPFDESAVDFLETLDVPCYKIASFEITHLPLIKKAAQTGKPLIISTGMATVEEIERAIKTAKDAGNKDLMLLKCTSAYPAKEQDLNLATLVDMRERFGCLVGFSDHTSGCLAAALSVALGACMIEKHVTLELGDNGVDAAFSLGKENYSQFVEQVRSARAATGNVFYGPTEAEIPSLIYRRAVHVVRPIKAGEVISEKDLKIVRPAVGLNPMYFDEVAGKKAERNLEVGQPLHLQDVA
jgi:pseudaminic acid synthase